MIRDGDFSSPLPLTGSHEPCGTVVEVGSNVKGFKKGDRIGTLPFMHPCGECPDCKSGTDNYCDNMKGAIGINTDGAFSEVNSIHTLEVDGSTLSVIRLLQSTFQTLSPSSMPLHFFVLERRSMPASRRQISRREMY